MPSREPDKTMTIDFPELGDDDLLMAFIITVPEGLTKENRSLIIRQWEEFVRPAAVESMRRFVQRLEPPDVPDIDRSDW